MSLSAIVRNRGEKGLSGAGQNEIVFCGVARWPKSCECVAFFMELGYTPSKFTRHLQA